MEMRPRNQRGPFTTNQQEGHVAAGEGSETACRRFMNPSVHGQNECCQVEEGHEDYQNVQAAGRNKNRCRVKVFNAFAEGSCKRRGTEKRQGAGGREENR